MGSSPRRRLLTSIREHGETLGVLAGSGLIARIPWARLADSDVVALPVSVVANVSAELGTVATVVEFVLLYVLYTSFASALITGRDAVDGGRPAGPALGERPWFCRFFAVASLGFAALTYYGLIRFEGGLSEVESLFGSLVWLAVVVFGLTAYLRWTTGSLAPGNPVVGVLDVVTPFDDAEHELAKTRNVPGLVGRVGLGLWWLAGGVLLAIPAYLLGVVGGVLSGFFPLLEGLVLGWLALDRAAPLLPADLRDRLPARERVAIDLHLFAGIGSTFHSVKAAMVTVFAFLGIGVTAATFAVGVRLAPGAFRLVVSFITGLGTPDFPVFRAAAIVLSGTSGIVAAFVSGLYGLWYWIRTLRRLPAFVAWWEDARRSTPRTATEADLPDAPTRPVGYMLPPSLLVMLSYDWAAPSPSLVPDRGAYLLLWGGVLLVTFWTVYRTANRRPQPPRSDGLAVLLALVVQLGGFFVGGVLAGTGGLTTVAFYVLLLVLAYYLPDVVVVANRHEDDRLRFAHGGYLLLGSGVFAALSHYWAGESLPLPTLMTAITAAGGVALVIGRALDDKFH